MGAHIGVTNLDGHTAPAVGAVQTRDTDISVETEKERDATAVTKWFVPQKFYRKEVEITGVGDAELSLVVAGAVAKGTLAITRAKQMQSNKGLSKFERSGFLVADHA